MRSPSEFQFTRPVGGATHRDRLRDRRHPGFNSRAPWGARREVAALLVRPLVVSIHAPRGGRDLCRAFKILRDEPVSIHAPRGGRDAYPARLLPLRQHGFNSRAPWGARLGRCCRRRVCRCFNSRAPWGARRSSATTAAPWTSFNSRAPWGARPVCFRSTDEVDNVSIHAPRGGRDAALVLPGTNGTVFQFTRPVGGATGFVGPALKAKMFQFTRPVGGATSASAAPWPAEEGFNSRAPWGARRDVGVARLDVERVSIHAPRGGRDAVC